MVYIYCKTTDDLKKVGQLICSQNASKDKNHYLWKIDESDEDCYSIQTSCNTTTAAILAKISKTVICIETDEKCASKIIEPLIRKYGFDQIKWLLIN